MLIVVYILFGLMGIAAIYGITRKVKEISLFKKGRNPYHRICMKCGAHQVMYTSNIEGDNSSWWEDVYPIGNDEKCACHSFTNYHH